MRTSSKILLIIVISLAGLSSNAQTVSIRGGLNLANMLEKDDFYTYSTDYNPSAGLHFGPVFEFSLTQNLYLSTGILLGQKGARFHDEILGNDVLVKAKLVYLDLPLSIMTSYSISDQQKVFLGAGGYIGMGVTGEIDAIAVYSGGINTGGGQIKWGYNEEIHDYRNIDFGVTASVGFVLNHFILAFTYDHGLENISTYQDFGATSKNRVFRISTGYIF